MLLDGVNNNITISYTSDSITVSGSGTCTEHYTSGSSASGTFTIGASGFSVSGTGFSYSNYVVSVTENSGSERQGTVTAAYSGATSVQRTITQQHVVYVPGVGLGSPNIGSTSIQLVAAITDDGDGTISDCGFNFGEESGNLMTYDADEVVQSGNFTKTISKLTPSTTYYWNAWATNDAGTTTTSESSVSTLGIVSGSITAAQFQFGYTKADVTLVIDNDTAGQVNLGVISCTIKDGSTTVGSSSFNLGNNVVINAGATFNGSVSVTTSGANQSHTHIAYTSSIPQGVGVLQRTVTPPDI